MWKFWRIKWTEEWEQEWRWCLEITVERKVKKESLGGGWECQHTAVNGKLFGEYSAVEYNEVRKRSWRWSVNVKLSIGIKLLVTGKWSEKKWENGVGGGSVNEMMPIGSYLENTVNVVIENTVIGYTEIQWLRNKKQEWKVECQRNAVNGKLSRDYSEWEMRKGSGRWESQLAEWCEWDL